MTLSRPIDFMMSPEEVIRQGSKSFSLATVFLPKSRRERILLLYRWCRHCDDAIDHASDVHAAKASIAQMENRMSQDLTLVGPEWVDEWQRSEFIAGMRMDVEGCHYETLLDLEKYCFRVAGVVGLMMCPLLGARTESANSHAIALGSAMQLTNIARDVQEDARLGRIYISKDLLPMIEPETLASNPELAHLAVLKILRRADELYAHGFQGIYWLPWRVSFAIAIAGKVYQRIGHKLIRAAQSNADQAFRRRTVVSRLGKLVAVAQGILLVFQVKALGLLGVPRTIHSASPLTNS